MIKSVGTCIDVTFRMQGDPDELEWLVSYRIPDYTSDIIHRASEDLVKTVESFYRFRIPSLPHATAITLLAVRRYSKALTEHLVGHVIEKRDIVSRIVAGQILQHDWMLIEAIRCSDVAFADHLDDVPLGDPEIEIQMGSFLTQQFGALDHQNLKSFRGVIVTP